MMTRQEFLVGISAVAVMGDCRAVTCRQKPELTVGLLSDLHISDRGSTAKFRMALRRFDEMKADAVLVSGDLTDWGLVSQLECVAQAWNEVFAGGRRSDGGRITKLLHYGDHDIGGLTHSFGPNWPGWEALRRKHPNTAELDRQIIEKVGRKEVWERVFGEEWSPVMRRQVNGYDFLLSNFTWGEPGNEWGDATPGFGAALENLSPRKGRPFFCSQHRIYRNTAGGPDAPGQDDGSVGAALAGYPDAFCFCGHGHLNAVDETSIWQGAFTAVELPSLQYTVLRKGRENSRVSAAVDFAKTVPPRQMKRMETSGTRQAMVMRVYSDVVVISRFDVADGLPLGPDWTVPLDGSRPFGFKARRDSEVAPQFLSGAGVEAVRRQGEDRHGTPTEQWVVSFPAAREAADVLRAYEYEVLPRSGRAKLVYSPQIISASARDVGTVSCVFAVSEVPEEPVFSVTPIGSFGSRGKSISS